MAVTFDFGGDASRLIAEMRKIQQEVRAESQTRREADRISRQLSKAESDRIRDQIRFGRQAKQSTVEMSQAAIDALQKAKSPWEEYTAKVFQLNQALQKGAISQGQFRQAKFAMLRVLRESKREQEGENEKLRDAARLVNSAQTAQDRYRAAIEALNLALKRGKIDQQQHAAGVRQAGLDFQKASGSVTSFSSSLMSTAGTLTGITGGVAAALKVVAELRAEYERLISAQRDAAAAHVPLAAAQSQMVKNLGVDPEFNAQDLVAFIRQQSQGLGLSETDLTLAISDALSARGDESARSAVEGVLAAAKFERFGGVDTFKTLAASSLDISKATGLNKEESLGFLSQIGQLSRVTNTKELSANVGPAVANALSAGVSREFAGALVSALTQGIVDEQGRVSRTTLTRIITQLQEFDPSANVQETFFRLSKDSAARQEFLDGASFESKALFAVRDVFTEGTKVQASFLNAFKVLSENAPQGQFDSVVSQVDALESVRIARMQQELANTTNQAQLADVEGAMSGAIRDQLDEMRKAIGRSGLGAKLDQVLTDVQTGGVQNLESLRAALEREKAILSGGDSALDVVGKTLAATLVPAYGGSFYDRMFGGDPEQNEKQVNLIQKMIDRVDGMQQELIQLEALRANQQPAKAEPGASVPKPETEKPVSVQVTVPEAKPQKVEVAVAVPPQQMTAPKIEPPKQVESISQVANAIAAAGGSVDFVGLSLREIREKKKLEEELDKISTTFAQVDVPGGVQLKQVKRHDLTPEERNRVAAIETRLAELSRVKPRNESVAAVAETPKPVEATSSDPYQQAEILYQRALKQLPEASQLEAARLLKAFDSPDPADDIEARAKSISKVWAESGLSGDPSRKILELDPFAQLGPVMEQQVSLLQDIRDSLRLRPGAAVAAQSMEAQREAVARYRNREGAA